MQTLIAITYPNEAQARGTLDVVAKAQSGYLARLEDACIVTRDPDGKAHLHQMVNTTATGGLSGAFWGTLIGLIFLNPLLGLVVGGATGAVGGAITDYGISDDFMKGLAKDIQPGSAALFLMLQDATLDRILPELAQHGGSLLYTNLSKEAEARFAGQLDNRAAFDETAGIVAPSTSDTPSASTIP